MNFKTKIIISITVILTAFAFGRYSVNQAPAVHTIEDIKTDKDIDKDKVTHTVTVITTKSDGTSVTTIDKKTQSKSQEKDEISSHLDQIITSSKQSKINISFLGANDFSKSIPVPIYGLSVSKEFIGPITVGAFGLTNGVIGLSIGLDL